MWRRLLYLKWRVAHGRFCHVGCHGGLGNINLFTILSVGEKLGVTFGKVRNGAQITDGQLVRAIGQGLIIGGAWVR
jgi:hypothetical protein